jgi:modulator of FtsH protease HflK
MDKTPEKTLAAATFLSAVCAGINMVLSRRTHLPALPATLPFLVFSCFVSALVMARTRLARLTEEEKRDRDIERKERPDSALFEDSSGEPEAFSIARTRNLFERFGVPAVAPILAVAGAAWAWGLYRALAQPADPPVHCLLASAVLAFESFLLFLFSRYLLALSGHTGLHLLRGPGILLGVSCLAGLVATLTAVAAEMAFPAADRIAALALTGAVALFALESVMNAVANLYRPRRKDTPNTTYESRIGRLLTDPASWARSLVQTMDYQFGFTLSETWLFRFLEKALLPLVMFQLVVLYALSTLVFIGPEEEGILERFGHPRDNAWHLESGFHAKWPWPFETVRRYPARRIQTLHLGCKTEGEARPSVLLWTVPHSAQEDLFLVASRSGRESAGGGPAAVPVAFLAVSVPIEYRITNVYQFAYHHATPRKVLEQIAYRSLCIETVSRDLFDILGSGQTDTARALRRRIQQDADRLGLGVGILFVGLQGVHPPVAVADAFESVVGAQESREGTIFQARAYTNHVLPIAAADAERLIQESRAFADRRATLAEAEASRFLRQSETCKRSPRVFRSRTYLGALCDALAHTRKYIVAANVPHEVIQLNLEEKLNPDLFDLGPAADATKGAGP